jgi:hypothetical protein
LISCLKKKKGEKMKKIKIKINKADVKVRKDWGGLKPHTRRQSNKKIYKRSAYKNKRSWY